MWELSYRGVTRFTCDESEASRFARVHQGTNATVRRVR